MARDYAKKLREVTITFTRGHKSMLCEKCRRSEVYPGYGRFCDPCHLIWLDEMNVEYRNRCEENRKQNIADEVQDLKTAADVEFIAEVTEWLERGISVSDIEMITNGGRRSVRSIVAWWKDRGHGVRDHWQRDYREWCEKNGLPYLC